MFRWQIQPPYVWPVGSKRCCIIRLEGKQWPFSFASPGPSDEDPVRLSACVHIPGLTLQDIWASWLSTRCGPDRHLPCGCELQLRPLCYGHVWLHLWEPAAQFLHEWHTFLLLVSSNGSIKPIKVHYTYRNCAPIVVNKDLRKELSFLFLVQ